MNEYKIGDRVRVVMPLDVVDGQTGTVADKESLDDGLIKVVFDDNKGHGWLDWRELRPVAPDPEIASTSLHGSSFRH